MGLSWGSRGMLSLVVAGVAVAVVLAAPAHGDVYIGTLYENGSWITGLGNGAGEADTSRLEPSRVTGGFNADRIDGWRVADDFTVGPEGWHVETITFYAYEPDSGLTSTIQGVFLTLWDGPPDDPASQVVVPTSDNLMALSFWTGVYRVGSNLLNDRRPVMAVVADVVGWIPDTLPAGAYWIECGLEGAVGVDGPYVVPTVPSATPLNGMIGNGSWGDIDDGGSPNELAFSIFGNVAPEPATMAFVGLGVVMLLARRRRWS